MGPEIGSFPPQVKLGPDPGSRWASMVLSEMAQDLGDFPLSISRVWTRLAIGFPSG
jgi:hypothetical protein